MARLYLGRLPDLTPGARAELGERISAAVRAQVSPPPPPGTPAPPTWQRYWPSGTGASTPG